MNNKLTVSPSPHIRDNATTASIMLDVVIALIPAIIMSIYVFGMRAALIIAVCVASSVAFEYIFNRMVGKPCTIGDLSAVVTGVILALNLPVTLPLWMAIFGCAVAIIVAKGLFGGIGANFANPAILARVVMLVSFAKPMTEWLIPSMTNGSSLNISELVSGATPLALAAEGSLDKMPSYAQMAIGTIGGSLGETSAIALALGGIYLIARRVITATTPIVFLGTVGIMTALLGHDPILHLLTGGLFLGAIFMATDYSTSPLSERGKVIFGLGCGIITVVIRLYGSYPEGVSFAILIMNILTPHIDRLTKTKPFGGVKA